MRNGSMSSQTTPGSSMSRRVPVTRFERDRAAERGRLELVAATVADMLTTGQAAARLGISPGRVIQLATAHERGRHGLESIRTPLGRLYPREAVEIRRQAKPPLPQGISATAETT